MHVGYIHLLTTRILFPKSSLDSMLMQEMRIHSSGEPCTQYCKSRPFTMAPQKHRALLNHNCPFIGCWNKAIYDVGGPSKSVNTWLLSIHKLRLRNWMKLYSWHSSHGAFVYPNTIHCKHQHYSYYSYQGQILSQRQASGGPYHTVNAKMEPTIGLNNIMRSTWATSNYIFY